MSTSSTTTRTPAVVCDCGKRFSTERRFYVHARTCDRAVDLVRRTVQQYATDPAVTRQR